MDFEREFYTSTKGEEVADELTHTGLSCKSAGQKPEEMMRTSRVDSDFKTGKGGFPD